MQPNIYPLQILRFLQPQLHRGIGGHAPVSPGTQTNASHLHTVGHTTALELLGEEPAVEGHQPLLNNGRFKVARKSPAGKGIDLLWGKSIPQNMENEEMLSAGSKAASSVMGTLNGIVKESN